jgi:hypothetical protein
MPGPRLFCADFLQKMERPRYHEDYGRASSAVTSARLSIEVTAVPEPSSLALGLAAVGWLLVRRRLSLIG